VAGVAVAVTTAATVVVVPVLVRERRPSE